MAKVEDGAATADEEEARGEEATTEDGKGC